ncbi:6-O-methylguanine DNA methyltransferase [Vibrio sp. UCD-FRSSP16_10]|uniref:methylated-DNA--[protein]-cysteine S-methyltransferase n=1 Tax=unclassified Vibrio TaxID=2614977 RepID=UPI000800E79F|nr:MULTISPECIES: methylated-DNA--[protein]-cysteine S-methyltransferase [unclassified Vibrio]OBT16970.1 6-O-methylguanine DNA methyltransferase [Vibrio sp. UCD-FRSSP16_30]OBT21961.1 6-O-methylguanine DNA methyltransferase [Vibrio sp. UCD-FRSSP16_10]
MSSSQQRHYQTVEKAIEYIRAHAHKQPSLSEIAEHVYVSEHHLQRIFTEWAGISPKRFMQSITKERALQQLKRSNNLLEVADNIGLSDTGRLHDLLVSCEAMTPGEAKSLGEQLVITFGSAQTPFGIAVIGWTDRGICFLQFVDLDVQQITERLQQQWPLASLQKGDAQPIANSVFSGCGDKIHLLVKGTNFQIKVWEALIKSHSGQLLSYSQIAKQVGSPNASRAVGTAIASNSIGFLIPCHRVIRGDGDVGQFRWGSDRKVAIQGWEAVHCNE